MCGAQSRAALIRGRPYSNKYGSATTETAINYRAPRLKSITYLFMIKPQRGKVSIVRVILVWLHALFCLVYARTRTEFN